MSKSHQEEIVCPKCGEHGEFTLWESVNVDLDQELREKIFNEELFLWTCPKCGERAFIPFGTIYHDMAHKFMLFYQYDEPETDKYAPLELPDTFGSAEDYTFRVVYGLDNLKEKIRMLESGIKDVPAERMKHMIVHLLNNEIKDSGYHLYFANVNYDSTEEHEFGTISFVYFDEKGQAKGKGYDMQLYYEHSLACELDPRMKVEGCQCVDEQWMSQQLKKEE